MPLTITPDAFARIAQAMAHEQNGVRVDLKEALPLINSFLQNVKPNNFDPSEWHWRSFAAWVESPPDKPAETHEDAVVQAFFPPNRNFVGVDVNCAAGLLAFKVETQAEGLWGIHVRDSVLVAKTESWWDGFKRFVGYEEDVKIDEKWGSSILYIPYRYRVEEVVGLSQLPAAQALYEKLCK